MIYKIEKAFRNGLPLEFEECEITVEKVGNAISWRVQFTGIKDFHFLRYGITEEYSFKAYDGSYFEGNAFVTQFGPYVTVLQGDGPLKISS